MTFQFQPIIVRSEANETAPYNIQFNGRCFLKRKGVSLIKRNLETERCFLGC